MINPFFKNVGPFEIQKLLVNAGISNNENFKKDKIYNVSDNEWANRREIVDWIAGALSLPKVAFDDQELMGAPNRKVSSDRIRNETGWSPFYSSFRKAYQEMLAS